LLREIRLTLLTVALFGDALVLIAVTKLGDIFPFAAGLLWLLVALPAIAAFISHVIYLLLLPIGFRHKWISRYRLRGDTTSMPRERLIDVVMVAGAVFWVGAAILDGLTGG